MKLGILGCGKAFYESFLPAINTLNDSPITSVCLRSEKSAQKAGRASNTYKTFTDVDEFLTDPKVGTIYDSVAEDSPTK